MPPLDINELSKIVLEKLIATRRSQEYSTWKLIDAKKESERLKEEGRDLKEIETRERNKIETDKNGISKYYRSICWFKFRDSNNKDHEVEVVARYVTRIVPYHKPEDPWTYRRRDPEPPKLDPEVYDWMSGTRLA